MTDALSNAEELMGNSGEVLTLFFFCFFYHYTGETVQLTENQNHAVLAC